MVKIRMPEMDGFRLALAKEDLKGRVCWYETKLQSLGDELNRVRVEYDAVKAELAIAQSELERCYKELVSLKKQVREYESEMARLRSKLRNQEPQPSPRPYYRWGLLP